MSEDHEEFHLQIPKGLKFTDLDIQRDPKTNEITVNMDVADQVVKANGIDMDDFLGSMLIGWYKQWLEGGAGNCRLKRHKNGMAHQRHAPATDPDTTSVDVHR